MIWHRPRRAESDTLAVIVPVGPAHDPVEAIRTSCRSAAAGRVPAVHLIVLNGQREPGAKAETLRRALAPITADYALVSIDAEVGYVRAIRYGLHLADELGLRPDRVGFLDADARLTSARHWAYEMAALDGDPRLDAVSGLVVHPLCQVWETLSSAAFVQALEGVFGAPVDKPYLQGGAGGSLARRGAFSRAVETALRLRTLVGPTLSASAVATGRHVRATSALPCRHTVRRTWPEWVESVSAYEWSWRRLVRLHGPGIEEPWRRFLAVAERALADRPALLRDVRRNTELRREIVRRMDTATASPPPWYEAHGDRGVPQVVGTARATP
jgi:hypothetical protein